MALTLLLLSLLAQQEEKVYRSEKEPYGQALEDCDAAAGIVDSDPNKALDLLTRVIDNPALRKKECVVRIEITPGTFGRRREFFPYHHRGRVRIKLAESADRDRAITLLEGAVEDLKHSVDRGVEASSEPLEKAKKRLDELKSATPGLDPEPEFARLWNELILAKQFAKAKEHIQTKGDFLTEEKRARYLKDTENRCRTVVGNALGGFLANLESVQNLKVLAAMRPDAFQRNFELPSAEVLAVSVPEYDWCLSVRGTIEELHAGKDALEALFGHAAAAVPLVEQGENRWYAAVENLAFQVVREAIDRRVAEARDATKDRRAVLRSEAEALVRQWQDFDARVREAAKENPEFLARLQPRDVAAALERFPVDDDSVNRIAARIASSAEAEDPDKVLAEAEAELDGLMDRMDRLSLESRRSIVTHRIVAGALRLLLAGRTEKEVSEDRDVRRFGARLKGLGDVPEVKSYGPRVQKVFELLR